MFKKILEALAVLVTLITFLAPASAVAQASAIPGATQTAEGRWEIPCGSVNCDPITIDIAGDWNRTNPAHVVGRYRYYMSATVDWQMYGPLKAAVQQIIHVHNAGSFPELLAEWAGYHVYCADTAWATVLVVSEHAHYVLAVDRVKGLLYVIEVFGGEVKEIHPILVGRQWVETKVETYERLKIVGDAVPFCADTAAIRSIEKDCPEEWAFEDEFDCPECEDCPPVFDTRDDNPGDNLRLGGVCYDTLYVVRLITCDSLVIRRDTIDRVLTDAVRCPGKSEVTTVTYNDCPAAPARPDTTSSEAPEPYNRLFLTGNWQGRALHYRAAGLGAERVWTVSQKLSLVAGGGFELAQSYADPGSGQFLGEDWNRYHAMLILQARMLLEFRKPLTKNGNTAMTMAIGPRAEAYWDQEFRTPHPSQYSGRMSVVNGGGEVRVGFQVGRVSFGYIGSMLGRVDVFHSRPYRDGGGGYAHLDEDGGGGDRTFEGTHGAYLGFRL